MQTAEAKHLADELERIKSDELSTLDTEYQLWMESPFTQRLLAGYKSDLKAYEKNIVAFTLQDGDVKRIYRSVGAVEYIKPCATGALFENMRRIMRGEILARHASNVQDVPGTVLRSPGAGWHM